MRARGRFTVAISGGRTPWVMLRALSERDDVPWQNVHVLQVDERVAPAGHADRNLTHLRESLLARRRPCGADPCDARGMGRPRRSGGALRTDARRDRRIAAGHRSRSSGPGSGRTHRVAGARRSGARCHGRGRRADRAVPGPAPDDVDLSDSQPRAPRALAGHRRGQGGRCSSACSTAIRRFPPGGFGRTRRWCIADCAAAQRLETARPDRG